MKFLTQRKARMLGATMAVGIVLASCQAAPAMQQDVDPEKVAAEVAASKERADDARSSIKAGAPATGPALQKDKFVVLIPCSRASEGCARPAVGAAEAAKAIGWRAQIIDGKDTASTQNAAVQQALALNPDGIITFAIDPETIQGSVAQARKQGVKVVASSATSSNLVDFSDNPTVDAWKQSGSLLADYAIEKTEGQVKALVLHDTGFDVLEARHGSFIERLNACPTCEVLEDQTFTFADLANAVPRLVQQMAQRNPDFNTVYIDYDYAVPSVLQGLRSVGAADKIVLGSDGTSAAIESIRNGTGQSATTAFALGWIGWSQIDAMNRLFAGERPDSAADVLGVKLIDDSNAGEIPDLWEGDVDFREQYLSLWGVK